MSSVSDRLKLPARYGAGEKSVWVEYIQLAAEFKPAVNLGQGYPDFPPPKHVTKALAEIASGDNYMLNQYTKSYKDENLKLAEKLLREWNSKTT